MSETLHDGGGHNHMGHANAGGHSGLPGQIAGFAQGHSFLAHLLGLDGHQQQHGGHSGHHAPGAVQPGPQGSASWNSALHGLKLSDALQGINVTPNTMFLMLFMGMGIWLYVVYFVRHHEPLANQVLGSGAAHSATAIADRGIVDGVRNAIPLKTSSATGAIYVPNTPVTPEVMPAAAANAATPFYGSVTGQAVYQPGNLMQGSGPAYHLSVQTPEGMRLKTVVNR